MKWFRHFTKALTDPKIEKLIMRHGLLGYGLYFACLEIIAGNLTGDNITFDLEHDAEILAYKFRVDTLKIEEMMKTCIDLGLFEYNNVSKRVQCIKLLEYIDDSSAKNPEIKKIVAEYKTKKSEKDEIQNISENFGKIQKDSDQIRLDYIRLDKINKNNAEEKTEAKASHPLKESEDRKTSSEDAQDNESQSSLDTSSLDLEESIPPAADPPKKTAKENWYKKSDNGKAVAYIKKMIDLHIDGYIITGIEQGIMKNIVSKLRKTDEEGKEVFNWELFHDKWVEYVDDSFWLDKGCKNLVSFYNNFNRIAGS